MARFATALQRSYWHSFVPNQPANDGDVQTPDSKASVVLRDATGILGAYGIHGGARLLRTDSSRANSPKPPSTGRQPAGLARSVGSKFNFKLIVRHDRALRTAGTANLSLVALTRGDGCHHADLEGSPPMLLLRSPAIDIALPLAFAALAYVMALLSVRAGRADIVGLCLTMFVAGLLWLREVALLPPQDMEDRDA